MTKVEMFEVIRRDHLLEGKSVRQIARSRGVHRRVVRQALADAVPPPRKPMIRACPTLTPAMCGVVDAWLVDDDSAPRKQHHTARRIWERLRAEHGFQGAESTLRRYVGRRKRERGRHGDVFIPLDHQPGEEAEVDFYEAYVDFPQGRTKVYVLDVRACASGRAFHVAYLRLTQQALLDGIVRSFAWFGGVFARLRFDNLVQAVSKILRGRRRVETDRFVALRSHYLFEAEFCRPGKEGAHEKGGVEGNVGHHRRNYLVPVPTVDDLAALNRLLADCCAVDSQRRPEGSRRTIGEAWTDEIPHLRALPKEPFDIAEVATHTVDSKSRVKVRMNHYSVPVRLSGRRVEVRVLADRVVVVSSGKIVADHERLVGRHGERLVLDHYLELLKHRPAALARSRPLRQARERDEWPATYDELWSRWRARQGEAQGTRDILDVLMLHRDHAAHEVHEAVEHALRLGIGDAAALAVLLRQRTTIELATAPLDGLGALDEIGGAASDDFAMYDRLLRRGAA